MTLFLAAWTHLGILLMLKVYVDMLKHVKMR